MKNYYEIEEENAGEYTCSNPKWSSETERIIEKYNESYRAENPGNEDGIIDLETLADEIIERIQEALS